MRPLADTIRPQSLDEYIGQEHLVGDNKPLHIAINKKHLFSFILWGPPGVGKTTLARIYARALETEIFELSAVSAGKADIKKIIDKTVFDAKSKILFLDEIHRFNKAQQDFLLPYVESGELTLIGATTENPSFEVIAPLLSRCRIFTLQELTQNDIKQVLARTKIKIDNDALNWIINIANGDARQALTVVESTLKLYKNINIKNLTETVQSRTLLYDKKGEMHYDVISAFIKSLRASQVDAALYYLARMIEAGEDPKFIARRIVIFASEDIGVAQPTALVVANAVFRAVETIGYPECSINLAHGVVYLCQCKKDRRTYDGLQAAQTEIKKSGNLAVPLKIRNAPTKLIKDLGYGKNYEQYDKNDFLPKELEGFKFFI